MIERWKSWSTLERQWAVAGLLTAYGVVAALAKLWPFNGTTRPLPANPSIWQYLLSDRITVGLARAGIVGLGVFIILSVPALILDGRWMKSFGSRVDADTRAEAKQTLSDQTLKIREMDEKIEALSKERDTYKEALRAALEASATLVQLPDPKEPTASATDDGG